MKQESLWEIKNTSIFYESFPCCCLWSILRRARSTAPMFSVLLHFVPFHELEKEKEHNSRIRMCNTYHTEAFADFFNKTSDAAPTQQYRNFPLFSLHTLSLYCWSVAVQTQYIWRWTLGMGILAPTHTHIKISSERCEHLLFHKRRVCLRSGARNSSRFREILALQRKTLILRRCDDASLRVPSWCSASRVSRQCHTETWTSTTQQSR